MTHCIGGEDHLHQITIPCSITSAHTHIIRQDTPTSIHHRQIMPLEHVVTYQAFREITNFICDNGDDWGEFCHNTSCPSTTRKPLNLRRRQIKRSRTTRMPKPQANLLLSHFYKQIPIVSSSSPSNTMTSGGCTRRPKLPSGPLKKLTLQTTLRIGINSRRQNYTSSYMFSPSSRPSAASSTRISVAISQPKSHHRKPDASTASRSPSKTSTARRTHSSSTCTSRTPRRRCTSCERLRPSPVSSGKHSGCSDGATSPQPALPNA